MNTNEAFNKLCDDLPQRKNAFDKFNALAAYLFGNCCLKVLPENREFYFTELEFYYESPEHPDKFRHDSCLQGGRGEIYWHKSGIDITIGDGEKNIFGGVLVRGIKERKQDGSWEYKTGPRKLVSESILPALGISNAVYAGRQKLLPGTRRINPTSEELVQQKDRLIFACVGAGLPCDIWQGYRVGLNKGKFLAGEKSQLTDFIYRPYRYRIDIDNDKSPLLKDKEKMCFISAALGLAAARDRQDSYLQLAHQRGWNELEKYYLK